MTENHIGISAETFRFFRDLHRNNRKEWMDENRGRYRTAVVQPMRGLLDRDETVQLGSKRAGVKGDRMPLS